jgi:SecD/SecF fusion protein
MKKSSFAAIANQSLWETIRRSLATTFITLLPIASLLVFGGETLKDFAFAIFIGVASGAYSTIFIATPLLVKLKEREPEYARRKDAGLVEKVGMFDVPAEAEPVAEGNGDGAHEAEPGPEPEPALAPVAVEPDGERTAADAAAARREARRKRRRARPHGRR